MSKAFVNVLILEKDGLEALFNQSFILSHVFHTILVVPENGLVSVKQHGSLKNLNFNHVGVYLALVHLLP